MRVPARTWLGTALRSCLERAAAGWGGRGLQRPRVGRSSHPERPQDPGDAAQPSGLREAARGYFMVVVTLVGNGLLFPPRRRRRRGGR